VLRVQAEDAELFAVVGVRVVQRYVLSSAHIPPSPQEDGGVIAAALRLCAPCPWRPARLMLRAVRRCVRAGEHARGQAGAGLCKQRAISSLPVAYDNLL
jgi:hypothetical protein